MPPLLPALFAHRLRKPLLAWQAHALARSALLVISVEALRESDLSPLPCRDPSLDGAETASLHVLYFKLRRRTRVQKLIHAWSLRQGLHSSRLRLYHKGVCLYHGGPPSSHGGERALIDVESDPLLVEQFPLTIGEGDVLQLLVADQPNELDDVLMMT